MPKLMVESKESQSATVPVRWCLTKEDLETLQNAQALNPHILLIVRSSSRETRYLAPLNQMMEYLQFSKPGPSQVFATIVWCDDGKSSELRDHYLKRSDGIYNTDVVNSAGTDFLEPKRHWYHHLGSDRLELVLPQALNYETP